MVKNIYKKEVMYNVLCIYKFADMCSVWMQLVERY